ncbi:MAG TPA: fructosamine kinase [Mariniphaga anaerophila]|uniref:Fructosamine kinase n=1 Tax=Mariniphaga anaerophila TaxID=1484053 RepID=A0A831LR19_9BACT|nr:fructosamine kinase [Mariniphaga anaerophila]
MHFFQNDKTVLKEVESHLSEKFGGEVKILASDSLGGGCINHASKIETSAGVFFLKWNGNCMDDMFLREAESLEELRKAAAGQLVVPEVFAAKKVDASPGFLVLEYLESGYGSGDSDEILGRGLATIHKYSAEKFGFYHNNYCGSTPQDNSRKTNWAEFFRDNRLRFLLNLIQKERPLPVNEMQVYDRLLNKIPELVPKNSVPVLIHGDLWSGNYMNTTGGPALIDPASYYADCEMEMGIMTMFGGFSQRFYSAYNEVHPLPANWKERNRLYQLYHVLNHYYLFGGGYRSQALQIARNYL